MKFIYVRFPDYDTLKSKESTPSLAPYIMITKYFYVGYPDYDTLEFIVAATLKNTYEIYLCQVS